MLMKFCGHACEAQLPNLHEPVVSALYSCKRLGTVLGKHDACVSVFPGMLGMPTKYTSALLHDGRLLQRSTQACILASWLLFEAIEQPLGLPVESGPWQNLLLEYVLGSISDPSVIFPVHM